jgi:replicative DNA helicase
MTPETTGERMARKLEATGFKRTGDEWRGNSPLRAGSDSKSFVVRIEADGEHGAYHDHVTGEAGSLYQLAERMGVEITAKAPAQETKRAYAGLADYAAAHYAPVEAFTAAGWSEGTHKERPALIYKVGGKLRYRYLDGQQPPYEWEKGGKPAWYGLKRAGDLAAGRALILCNGEASTIAAQHRKLPACAWAGGEQKLPDSAVTDLRAAWTGPVILAYDCDETGQRVAREVAGQLMAAGYDVRVADLKMTDHGDLADFVGLHEAESYAELDKRAVAPTPDLGKLAEESRKAVAASADPAETAMKQIEHIERQVERVREKVSPVRVVELHDLVADLVNIEQPSARTLQLPIPELAALVGPLEPELYVIYGAPNMGKSWVAASFAASLLKQGNGLVITTETEPKKFSRRMVSYLSRVSLNRITERLATETERNAWMTVAASLDRYVLSLMDISSPSGKQVRQAALNVRRKNALNWLIVDSATRMRGSGDGIYERTSSVANTLQDMARDLQIPIIVTSQVKREVGSRPAGQHHPRLEDAYGGGVIEQNAGVVLGFYRHDYYVARGAENPDPLNYPEDTARMILLKHRNRPMPTPNYATVLVEPGCGIYQHRTLSLGEIERAS